MNKNKFFKLGMAVVLLSCIVTFTACGGKKDSGGNSDGSTSSGSNSAGNARAAGAGSAAALRAFSGNDPAAIASALKNPGGLAELTRKSASPSGDFAYDLNAAGDGIIIKKYTGTNSVVIIPEEIEGYPVVEINDIIPSKGSGFKGNTDLTAVVLPDTIKRIGDTAFEDCSNLRAINFPEGLLEIGVGAFKFSGLSSVVLPAGLQKISDEAFVNTKYTSLTFSSPGPKNIGQVAFASSDITELTLPEGLETIDRNAFLSCKKLRQVTLPASIKKIENGAFADCPELTDVIIPDSVTTIVWGGGSFNDDGKLKLAVRKRLQDLGYKGDF